VDIDQFTTLLTNSRLIERAEAEGLAAVFQNECRKLNTPITVEMFCDFLIASDRLTAWQCDKLRLGRWKGFYVDDYVILGHLGKDHVSSYCKARNTTDGALVRLAVTPSSRPPFFEYRIDSYSE
jgi:eukaryotic-like serine/threonine-protein kinase